MPYQTDERLKSYLDTSQLYREQMCRAVLAIDKRFTDVRPRHPRGGPDGGRDMEADFRQGQRAFGAVGFVNQANDSVEQKRQIKSKFSDDLRSALGADPKPDVFVFFTNINLTIGEKDALVADAKAAEFSYCDIFDRERIRITLDSPDGFFIRFQYLGLTLSEEEQASFFAKWGDEIQSVVSTGFQRIEKTLDRILFLQEAADVMSSLTLSFELDGAYSADDIGHFRAFCYMHLKEPKYEIFEVLFGSSDKTNRLSDRPDADFTSQQSGIKYGISGGQWERNIDPKATEEEREQLEFKPVGWSSAVGIDPVEFVTITYSHDRFIRYSPRLSLSDIDESSYMPMLNNSLAEKIKAIHVYSNGYKLQEIADVDFRIDTDSFNPEVPVEFTEDELVDPWVRVRPLKSSVFRISFADQTPKRLFSTSQTPNSLANRLQRTTEKE